MTEIEIRERDPQPIVSIRRRAPVARPGDAQGGGAVAVHLGAHDRPGEDYGRVAHCRVQPLR